MPERFCSSPECKEVKTYCLPAEDRERCIEISLEESDGSVPVCPAVGGVGIYDVANAASKAQEMSADMIAIIPPPWITVEVDAVRCIEQVSRSVEVPVMIHTAFGGPASKIFSSEIIDRLLREVPNIRYVKVEGPRFVQQAADINATSGDTVVRLMSAPNWGEVYRAGCRLLMIAAHIIEPVVAIFKALERKDDQAEERIDTDLAPYYAVEGYVPGEICNKTVAHWRGIFANARRGSPQLSPSPATLLPAERAMLARSLSSLMKYFTTFPLQLPEEPSVKTQN